MIQISFDAKTEKELVHSYQQIIQGKDSVRKISSEEKRELFERL